MIKRKLKSSVKVKAKIFSKTGVNQFPIVGIGASEGGLEALEPFTTYSETERKNISNLNKIIILLCEQSGHDFSLYKKSTLFRRIERRKGIQQIDKIKNYYRFLQENPKEVGILFNELLIGVTSFFRDTTMWQILKEKVFPELMNELPDGYILRAWVPACSTGEEAYSLAIVFKEVLESLALPQKLRLQIFATDLDSKAIATARKGCFSKNIDAEVSSERLSRYFTEEAEGFRVNNDIREMVIFAPQNVIKDPPFIKLDFLSCRNMLIYMEPELQNKLITLFNYCLKPGGILLLGTSETIGNQNEAFTVIDGKFKIFKRLTNVILPVLIDSPVSFYHSRIKANENKILFKTSQDEQQSINDELTTTREEMQNLNEELQTVNVELQSKESDFKRANDDIKNLLNNADIATLFLDKDLNIRRFSDQIRKIFKLCNADIGRPFTDLVTDLQYSEIDSHARQVIKTLKSVETKATTLDGRWFNVRIMLYRTLDDCIDGLVITFTDISAIKKIEIELKEAIETLRKCKEHF